LAITLLPWLHGVLQAQESLTLRDATIGQTHWMRPRKITQFQWRPQSDQFTIVGVGGKLMLGQAGEQDFETILYRSELNDAISGMVMDDMEQFPFYQWRDNGHIQFNHEQHFMVYDVTAKDIAWAIKYPKEAGDIDINPEKEYIAYSIRNNLFVGSPDGHTQISDEDNPDIKYGYHYTHRQEFGIWKGTFWSPTGRYLAFYRADQTKVTDYPLVDYILDVAELVPVKYPMAGQTSEEVTLGVYDTQSGETVYMKTGTPADQYLCSVSWGPDEEFVYIAVLNRDQDHLKLNKYRVADGRLAKTLFEEKDEKYVEPYYPLYFYDDSFAWLSRRDGYWHIYTYTDEGELTGQLTSGEWEITDVFSQSSDSRYLFFAANREDMLSRRVYRADLKENTYQLVTPEAGDHSMHYTSYLGLDYVGEPAKTNNSSGEYLYDSYSSLERPREDKIVNSNGEVLTKLKRAEDPMEDYKQTEIELFTIKAADGETDLQCRLYKPLDMEEGKKYPVLLYTYGGPHVSLIRNVWQANGMLWFHYLAELGIGVMSVDNRGSAYRGKAFEDVIHRDVGKVPAQDQMQAVEYLKAQDWVDMDRLALYGWSFGGFLSAYLMLKHPGMFKVCVSGAPVLNWEFYEVMYGERYMDTPRQNPDGYQDNKLIDKAGQMEGKFLLIHGGSDKTVVVQNSMQFIQACVDENKEIDFFVYPKEGHSIYGMPKVHLYGKITQYLLDNL
jgi:dipeptidyl-peptidase 4